MCAAIYVMNFKCIGSVMYVIIVFKTPIKNFNNNL